MTRRAVVLFNLGGPDSLAAVQPFLFNLFHDPAIIGLPGPLRWLAAQIMSRRRAPEARAIYGKLGGRSPLLEWTEKQAAALQDRLGGNGQTKTFIAMRYWHPMSDETARAVKAFDPDEVYLLPLYPQFSTTTTGSSIKDWRHAARGVGLSAPMRGVCCFPTEPRFIDAHAELIRVGLDTAPRQHRVRLLLSAHGLPQKIIEKGDPYQWQAEATAGAVIEAIDRKDLDWTVCYQSRIGPLAWIKPSIDDELARAARDGVAVVVAPIAFVSEHSETLVELDMDYAERARELGIPAFIRVPALGTSEEFISCLATLVDRLNGQSEGRLSMAGGADGRTCPKGFGGCAFGRSL